MNKFNFLCALAMLFCMALVGVACFIAEASWYVWLIALSANAVIVYLNIKSEWSDKKSSAHEQHLRCARVSWNFTGSLGLTSVILGVLDGVFGNVVIMVISLSVIWFSCVHFKDEKGKLRWWQGWFVTMSLMTVTAILETMSDLGVNISQVVVGAVLVLALLSCGVTLIIGIVLYVYPPIKELADDYQEIRDTIKFYENRT